MVYFFNYSFNRDGSADFVLLNNAIDLINRSDSIVFISNTDKSWLTVNYAHVLNIMNNNARAYFFINSILAMIAVFP